MAGKVAPRGLLRPLRGSGFALGQPDVFGAGAFPFRLSYALFNRYDCEKWCRLF